MIALTGIIFKAPMFFYSSMLHTKKLRKVPDGEEVAFNFFLVWAISIHISLAIVFQSTLLGYVVFGIIFNIVGFRIWFFPGCIVFGWRNEEDLIKSLIAAYFIVFGYIGLRIADFDPYYIEPFSSSCCVLGGNGIFLALLIMSSDDLRHNHGRWIPANLMMIFMIVLCMGIGSTYNIEGLRNTAIVYTVLWGLEKYNEIYWRFTSNPWFFIFSLSAFIYYVALYLNMHP